jgi:ubiquinone/menaquinone biosynthesis C-methylase UbiE
MTSNTVEESIVPFGPKIAWFWDRVVHPLVARPIESLELGFIQCHLRQLHDRGHMLDVGCGGGEIDIVAAEMYPVLRVTGVDVSSDLIRRANERIGHLGGRVDFVVGSATELPFGNDTFDLVISFGSLKLWPDRAKGLAECTRVLKPGGHLVVLEAERACRFENARAFLHDLGVPSILEPLLIALVRTWAGAVSLTSDEARAIASSLPLTDLTVTQLAGKPFFAIEGRKASAS